MAPTRLLAAVLVCAGLPRGDGVTLRVALPPASGLWTFLAYDIGLQPYSTVSVDLYNSFPANDTYVMLLTHAQLIAWRQADPNPVVKEGGQLAGYYGYMPSAWRLGLYDHARATFRINALQNDRYYLGVLNAQMQTIKIGGEISLVNPDGDQLRVQDQGVPAVLLWMSALFICTSVSFFAALLTVLRAGRSGIHFLIAAVVLLKGVGLLLQYRDQMQVSRTGTDSVLGLVGWQLVDKMQSIAELMMFLLISLGWKFLRQNLNVTEVRFVVGISVLSFYLGVVEITCTTATTCNGCELSRRILHSLCCLVVIVAMNFNLQVISSQISESLASMEAGRLYVKLRAYQAFRWVFIAFIIAPTVELLIKVSLMPWDSLWICVLLQELRCWVIYACVVVCFRPATPPRLFELTREEECSDEAAEDVA